LNPIILTPLTKEVKVEYTQNSVQLSSIRKREIEDFWNTINQHSSFHRGEVFNVFSIIEQDDLCKIMLNCTDYAHYLHTVRNNITDEEGCKVVYGAGLVETNDSKFVFGEMGSHTAYPSRLQCVGGGLSREDKKGNYFDINESVIRELAEELGVDYCNHIEKCTPVFIKKGGTYDFLVILYHIKLKVTAKELNKNYQKFTEELFIKGEKPEFQKVIYIENNKKVITSFFEKDDRNCVDYLQPYLEQMGEIK
jgi:hypothetical protein